VYGPVSRRQAMNAPIDNEAMKEREKQLEAGRAGCVTWLLNVIPRFLSKVTPCDMASRNKPSLLDSYYTL